MSKIVNIPSCYHFMGPNASVIGSVTKKCPVRNHNKIGDISEIMQCRKLRMAEYYYIDRVYSKFKKFRFNAN